jgi:phosphoglycerate dehydrogenase-like enzyme
MAEYVLGWCLWHTQRTELFRSRSSAKAGGGRWIRYALHGAELCIVGLGDIGRHHRARPPVASACASRA